MPEECAVKVFKTTLNEFKTRDRYIKDDHRFRDRFSKQNPRKIIKLWAEKEMCNLSRFVISFVTPPLILQIFYWLRTVIQHQLYEKQILFAKILLESEETCFPSNSRWYLISFVSLNYSLAVSPRLPLTTWKHKSLLRIVFRLFHLARRDHVTLFYQCNFVSTKVKIE